MKWAFVCCAHKRAASPPMRCAKRKVIRRPAALPRVFLLQISLYKKGNSRVASAAGVPNIHLLFSTTVLLPSTAKTGGLIIWFPPVSAEIQLLKNTHPSSKNRCVLEPLRFCAGVPFFVVEMWFPSFCRRHLRAKRARGVCGAHDTHIVEEEKVRTGQYL